VTGREGSSARAGGLDGRVSQLDGQFAFPAYLRRRQGRLADHEAFRGRVPKGRDGRRPWAPGAAAQSREDMTCLMRV